MADNEIKKTAPKKKVAAKKKTALQAEKTAVSKKLKIYETEEYLKPAKSMERDLVKILPRNPFQAYVFWKFKPQHFEQVMRDFSAKDPSEIQFKLKIEYQSQNGKMESAWYDLAPMTKSYFCNFPSPVNQLRAYIYAHHFGRLKLFLEAGDGDLPPGVESFSLDGDWIHPKWVEFGWVRKTGSGDWKFSETFDPEKDGLFDPKNFPGSFDGSSRTSSRASSGNRVRG